MTAGSKQQLRPFDPEHPRHRYKLWVRLTAPGLTPHGHFYWRRIAAALTGLAVAGWLATATAVWTFVKFQRGYTEASFLDLAFYPLRASHYRTGLGQHYIVQGQREFEKKNYITGYRLLLAGLARVPHDLAARRLVAHTQVKFGRGDLALKTLSDGATLTTADLDYLKLLFLVLAESHETERMLTVARSLLPAKPDAVLTHQFVALQAATALVDKGDYDDAESLLLDWHLQNSLEGEILLAKCDWERGYPELALARLERELGRFPLRDELYLNLGRLHRELGHSAEARRVALLRQFNDPASPGPRIDLLCSYRDTNDRDGASRELARFFADFKSDRTALLLLARFSVELARPALAAQVHDLAVAQKLPLNAFNLCRIQAALAAQDYRGADALVDAAILEENENNATFAPNVTGLRAIALFGLKDTARAKLLLTTFANQPQLSATDALLLGKQLRLLGAVSSAREVLERACVIDPLNQAALTELIRVDLEAGNRPMLRQNLPKLLQLRKPSRAVLQEALLRLGQPADAALRDQIRAILSRVTSQPTPN